MRDLPVITFIKGEPPAIDRSRRSELSALSPYICGVLQQKPGQWATVDADDNSSQASSRANRLAAWGKIHGLVVEAVVREGLVYARVRL